MNIINYNIISVIKGINRYIKNIMNGNKNIRKNIITSRINMNKININWDIMSMDRYIGTVDSKGEGVWAVE